MDQPTFLRTARRLLGLSVPRLADELGVSPRTVEKWALASSSTDHRRMPRIAWKFIARLLVDRKRTSLETGDRTTAETIDALLVHVDADRFALALQTFDALQRTANAFEAVAPLGADYPGYFESPDRKRAWNTEQELRHARRLRQAGTIAR